MKTPEELNALKEELETLNKKLSELTEEELEQVSSGVVTPSHVLESTGIEPRVCGRHGPHDPHPDRH